MKQNFLTPEEERVIVQKGTEPPFSGEYEIFWEEGTYVCKRCGSPLFRSSDKFNAHCGWPSFDGEIAGAIRKTLDTDGVRTEITCVNCGAHLGHLFLGENLTPKNARYCVNSVSMKFIPKTAQETAVFAGGCFWCVEAVFKMIRGVLSVEPGYAGGVKEDPTYDEVSAGNTGHAETVKIDFDPQDVSYEDLLNIFFYSHDPTSVNRQGDDIGPQYRSLIFYVSEKQKEIAEEFIKSLESTNVYKEKIATELRPFVKFYPAEDYHKSYFEKNKNVSYCQLVVAPKVTKAREKFKRLLR